MLEAVGRPVALNPDRGLARIALRNHWPSVSLRKPQRGATPISTIRTATAMGALAATAALGASAGIVTGNRQLGANLVRSEEHTSELQSLMRISYAVFCLKKKK